MTGNEGLLGSNVAILMHREKCAHSLLVSVLPGASAARWGEGPGRDSGPRGLDLTTWLSLVLHLCLHQSSFSHWVHQGICTVGAALGGNSVLRKSTSKETAAESRAWLFVFIVSYICGLGGGT